MGEAGLKLITRDGRTIAHCDEPADRLVASENASKIIIMARRGAVWSLSRVDVLSRKAAPWCHAEISRFATSFDGARMVKILDLSEHMGLRIAGRLEGISRIHPGYIGLRARYFVVTFALGSH